jgi:hypothetical protein
MGRIIAGEARAVDAQLKYMEQHFGGQKEITRRNMLKAYAEALAGQARNQVTTDCRAFSLILSFAATQFPNANNLGVEAMMEDLKSVLIGSGLENTQRNTGTYALRFQALLDTGFKEKFRDGGNQVQHAMAGLYVSYAYGWVGTLPAMLIEDCEQDAEVYRVTFKLGSALNAGNYTLLPNQIMTEMGA